MGKNINRAVFSYSINAMHKFLQKSCFQACETVVIVCESTPKSFARPGSSMLDRQYCGRLDFDLSELTN